MVASTPIRTIDRSHPDDPAIVEAGRILRDGGIVAFATETVYGLGADATNADAIAKIFVAKGRPSNNPLIVHAADLAMARTCVAEWSELADELAQVFWPGPLTLVLPKSPTIPDLVTAGRSTIGVRIPALRSARHLIAKVGRPLAAPSANRSNGLSPTTAQHVFNDLNGGIDLILDDGPCRVGLESTVLDLTGDHLKILRPGPIGVRELQRALGGLQVEDSTGVGVSSTTSQMSPGQFAIHYAPKTKALRVEGTKLAELKLIGPSALLVFTDFRPPDSPRFQTSKTFRTPEEAAENLYHLLHQWDDEGFSQIVVVLPPDGQEWRAVRDRLIRATTPGNF